MKYIEMVVDWVLNSSADPAKTSLTVRSALVFAFGFAVKVSTLACASGLACLVLDQGVTGQITDVLTNVVFWACSIIGSVGFLFGLGRKLWLTARGKLA